LNFQKNNKLLSICIPTRNRKDVLVQTLKSIFEENNISEKFEVIIYDTSDNLETKSSIKNFSHYENIIYTHQKDKGYLNLIESLKIANGLYLKLHNDYSKLNSRSIEKMIFFIEEHVANKPALFFTNGHLKNSHIEAFSSFDLFMHKINYLSTWSTMFGIWKDDFDSIQNCKIEKMFPHTSLLLELANKDEFIINDYVFVINQQISNKGGYNLFYTFSVVFLNLLKEQVVKKNITNHTYNFIKKKLLKDFLVKWYSMTVLLPNTYTFDLTKIKISILYNYSYSEYLYFIFLSYINSLNIKLKNIINNYLNAKRR
jgi:abequosyltransferase